MTALFLPPPQTSTENDVVRVTRNGTIGSVTLSGDGPVAIAKAENLALFIGITIIVWAIVGTRIASGVCIASAMMIALLGMVIAILVSNIANNLVIIAV